jgi:hypothetical protein
VEREVLLRAVGMVAMFAGEVLLAYQYLSLSTLSL